MVIIIVFKPSHYKFSTVGQLKHVTYITTHTKEAYLRDFQCFSMLKNSQKTVFREKFVVDQERIAVQNCHNNYPYANNQQVEARTYLSLEPSHSSQISGIPHTNQHFVKNIKRNVNPQLISHCCDSVVSESPICTQYPEIIYLRLFEILKRIMKECLIGTAWIVTYI